MSSALTYYPVPLQAEQFKGKFFMTYFDDDGNSHASTPFTQSIELKTRVEMRQVGSDDKRVETLVLTGRASRHTHQAYQLPLDHHGHGVCFSVASRNKHKAFHDQLLWRTYLNSRQIKELTMTTVDSPANTVVITGDVLQLPFAPEAQLTMTVHQVRGKGHLIDTVHLEIPTAVYEKYAQRIKD